ncbi:hypothetical protein LSH36_374g00025 [Paralvinella palmiformis]|uniref:Uncharacterized protein n=1 Tax=Paralvinella palmiformis TaxID=53620 RepID=A0AAD9JF09_9ANNE|nr:hypothetical protein LSH36_374g00025 [Paralvinella palmiformis]
MATYIIIPRRTRDGVISCFLAGFHVIASFPSIFSLYGILLEEHRLDSVTPTIAWELDERSPNTATQVRPSLGRIAPDDNGHRKRGRMLMPMMAGQRKVPTKWRPIVDRQLREKSPASRCRHRYNWISRLWMLKDGERTPKEHVKGDILVYQSDQPKTGLLLIFDRKYERSRQTAPKKYLRQNARKLSRTNS